MAELAMVAVLAFAFGLTSKTADLLNEHGLQWLRGASLASGFVWGALGVVLVLNDRQVAAVLAATVLYWFLRNKLDYANHATAGVMILLACLVCSTSERVDVPA